MAKPKRARRAASQAVSLASTQVDSNLDAQMPDYVRAELAGLDVQQLFSSVFAYLRDSAHARVLHDDLLGIEKRLLSQVSGDADVSH